eukprot:jgi/Psemu1/257671/estExt_Genewise1Plus.C_2360014
MSPNETSAALLQLCGRKHKSRMGANLNESVATGPSDFARKQLEKLGWTEGTGLGKNRDGRAEHIRVTKRKDELALGASAAAIELDPVVTGDQWWKSSKSKRKSRGGDGSDDGSDDDDNSKTKKKNKNKKRKLEYTDEELFEATGGARFGMRAQTQQKGKWNRAEDKISKEEEKEALAKTEWDGMAAPKVLLSKSSATPAATKDKEDESSIAHNISESEATDDKGIDADAKPRKKKNRKSSAKHEEKEKKAAKKEKKRKRKEEKKQK